MSKEILLQDFKERTNRPVDTIQLQLDSLGEFMNTLGFYAVKANNHCLEGLHGWRSESFLKDYPKFISFQDSVRLHNGVYLRQVGNDFVDLLAFKYEFHIPCDVYYAAMNARLVVQVKLQKLKKAPYIKAQSHWVKLLEDKL